MLRTLTFDIVYRYLENAKGITIPVTLTSPYGTYRSAAKADTSAEVCLFSNDPGLQLGLDVERGIPKHWLRLAERRLNLSATK